MMTMIMMMIMMMKIIIIIIITVMNVNPSNSNTLILLQCFSHVTGLSYTHYLHMRKGLWVESGFDWFQAALNMPGDYWLLSLTAHISGHV